MTNAPFSYLEECFEVRGKVLFWRERPLGHFSNYQTWAAWNAKHRDKPAGRPNEGNGRLIVGLTWNGLRLVGFAHRIVFAMAANEWPAEVDHIDGDHLNNSPDNLRAACRSQNTRNAATRKDNRSGFKGVSLRPDGRYHTIFRKKYYGSFTDPTSAHAVYCKLASAEYGEFFCDGRRVK